MKLRTLTDGRYMFEYVDSQRKRVRLGLGKSKPIAEAKAAKFTAWLLDGIDPRREMERVNEQARLSSITLRQYAYTFLKTHRMAKATKAYYEQRMVYLARCKSVVDVPMCEITKRAFRKYMDDRMAEGASATTVNGEKRTASAILGEAVNEGILSINPLSGLKALRGKRKRTIELTSEQVAGLVADIRDPVTQLIVKFAIYSGIRKNGILGLRISDVLFTDIGAIVRAKMKGGHYENVPISRYGAEVLREAIGERVEGYVFTGRAGGKHSERLSGFDKAVGRQGLTSVEGYKLRFHDLRHLYGTELLNAGVSLDDIALLLGHGSTAVTRIYTQRRMVSVAAGLEKQRRVGG